MNILKQVEETLHRLLIEKAEHETRKAKAEADHAELILAASKIEYSRSYPLRIVD